MRTLIQRVLMLVRRERASRELDEELQFHLDMSRGAFEQEGLSPDDAHHAARRRLGGSALRVREQAVEVWSWRALDALMQDVRYAVRVLRRQPRFLAAALATLALGIGANTAVFSLVDAMLLKPLPFADAERLVVLHSSRPSQGMGRIPLSYLNFVDVRQRAQSFEQMAGWMAVETAIDGRGGPEQVQAVLATAHLFQTLGVRPILGRTFLPAEEQRGARPVALISHGLWQRRFSGDPSIVGSSLTVDGRAHEIIGVLPAGFRFATFPHESEVWMPIGLASNQGIFFSRGMNTLGGIARLRPGATLTAARAELDTIANALATEEPGVNRGRRLHALPLQEQASAGVQTALLVMTAAVAAVLLLACANVANLLLVRASAREREMAIRAALGCSRGRLAMQLLVEHLLLALAGGALGLGLASIALGSLAQLPYNAPDLYTPFVVGSDQIALDRRVLLFTLGLSIATGLVFGLLPALRRQSAASLAHALAAAGMRATGDRRTMRLRGTLIVAEVALSAMLLTGMMLMLESFMRIRQVDPGLDPREVVAMDIRLPPPVYRGPSQIHAFYTQTLERVRALPRVTGAATVEFLPFSGLSASTGYYVDGRPPAPQSARIHTHYRSVSDGYFETLVIRVIRGRAFTPRDLDGAPRVAVINQAMARQVFPDEDPIGKRIALDFESMRFFRDRAPELDLAGGMREIVGVVADVRHGGLTEDAAPELFVPAAQRPVRNMTIVVRTNAAAASADYAGANTASANAANTNAGDTNDTGAGAIASAVRAIVRSIDPAQPVANVTRLDDLVATSIACPRFNTMLLSIFGLLALSLAAVGVYGVMSYTVALRTRDVGIHLALGATPRDVRRMILGQALILAAIGTIVGLAGAIAAGRVLTNLLFEVDPHNPWTFVAVAIVMGLTSVAAASLPARRALRIDAVTALRAD
jgi:putative ABC transport system permease protein